MKSVMSHQFSQVPSVNIPRSSFDRSHGHKTTFDAGYLVPVYVDEALPGDTFKMNATIFARMATPIHPIMDNMYMDIHFFSVPMRQLWDNFRKFMGEQVDPDDSVDYTIPQTTFESHAFGSVGDYMGLPLARNMQVSCLPFRAYKHIYNEWYRDQNLQDSEAFSKGDGPDDPTLTTLLRRGKRHDYFTSALPWPQKGDAVSLPLGTAAPVELIDDFPGPDGYMELRSNTTNFGELQTGRTGDTPAGYLFASDPPTADPVLSVLDPNGNLVANLTEASSATINSLRQAFAIQQLLERDARGGTRYAEIVNSHFGVNFLDVTYRPEYLGGGTLPININPVVQQSATDTETSPQGNLAAFGTTGGGGFGFTKSFTEHCIVMGIVSVRADLTYQRGINKMWSRETKYDFYWPALANIGEQAILNKELYYQDDPDDEEIFGYQERFAEYRYKPSIITSDMRSAAAQSLDVWHLSQDFSSLPVLGPEFIVENPPVDRVIAVPSEPHFIFDSYFNLRCARPMPLYGVPGMDRL